MIRTIKQKSRIAITASLMLGVIGSSVATFTTNKAYAATNCDKVNIVYCGVDGSSDASYINAFKSIYNSNKSGHSASPTVNKDYTDIQKVYAWAGATPAMVNGMNTTNTKIGTLYRDGRIVVDGKTIATGSWVSARFTEGAGFTKISEGVYARKTTTSFANATAKVLVYMPEGKMVFASMIECANAVKATPKVDTPKTPEKPETPKTPETPKEETPVTPTPEAPAELPKTGPASAIGLFTGVTLAGSAAHRVFQAKRRK